MKSIIRFIILGIGLAIGCSCKNSTSPVVKLFREHIGKEINLKGFEEVYGEQDTLSYSDFCKSGLWGLLQVYGYEPSKHSLYALTGSFYNPGPYSGFLIYS